MEEIWKPVIGYEGYYNISSFGRIFSVKKNREIIIKPYIVSKNGYKSCGVTLYKDKILKRKIIARLVAEAFIPNPENKPQVNHIDFNSLNNNISNLEWVTLQENIKHSFVAGRYSNTKPQKQKIKKLELYSEYEIIKNNFKLGD